MLARHHTNVPTAWSKCEPLRILPDLLHSSQPSESKKIPFMEGTTTMSMVTKLFLKIPVFQDQPKCKPLTRSMQLVLKTVKKMITGPTDTITLTLQRLLLFFICRICWKPLQVALLTDHNRSSSIWTCAVLPCQFANVLQIWYNVQTFCFVLTSIQWSIQCLFDSNIPVQYMRTSGKAILQKYVKSTQRSVPSEHCCCCDGFQLFCETSTNLYRIDRAMSSVPLLDMMFNYHNAIAVLC